MTETSGSKYPSWKWFLMLTLAVIGFFAVRTINAFDARSDETSKKVQTVCDRVTVLETNYTHIMTGINRLETTLKEHAESSRKGRAE